MVPIRLQIILILVSTAVFFVIFNSIKKQKLNTESGTVWILWGLGLIVISLFPGIVSWAGSLMGIDSPIHTIYLVMIFLLYLLTFVLYLKVSVLEEKVKNIIQLLSINSKKNEKTNRKNKN